MHYKMSRYTPVNVSLTDAQKNKIASAYKKKCPTSLKLSISEMDGDDTMFLTQAQINRMEKAKADNRGLTLKLSASQVRAQAKEGGFLPLIMGAARMLLPTVAKTLGLGALGGLAQGAVSKILGNGFYLKKPGSVCKIETDGKGLYLTPQPVDDFDQYGYCLYLVQDSNVQEGSGIIFGKNSPFSKIPLIGPLLGAIL